MSLKTYILRVLQMRRPHELIRNSEISSSLFFSTVPNPTYVIPTIFFLPGTPFPLFWISVFGTRSSENVFSKISGVIRKKSWKACEKVESSYFLFLGSKRTVTRLDQYIKSGSSRIRSFDIWKKNRWSCFWFFACNLAFLSFFLSSASCLLFSTSSRLKTKALWASYWRPVRWARCFFFAYRLPKVPY